VGSIAWAKLCCRNGGDLEHFKFLLGPSSIRTTEHYRSSEQEVAAQQLFEACGRLELPTVDAARRLSRTNMNDASAVMKEWRRLQIVSASAALLSVPDRVQKASQPALSALWTEAQEFANEALQVAQTAWDAERAEAEKLRVELSSAFETQGAELEALRFKLAEVEIEASTAAVAAEGRGGHK
jgi:colicin import membrane protein